MRLISLPTARRGIRSGRARQLAPMPRPAHRRWLRCPWPWWGLLVLLGLALQSAPLSHTAALPEAARGGISPLVALHLATPTTTQVASDCGITDLTSCINNWITSFAKDTIQAWFQQQVGNFEGYGFIFQTPDSLTWNAQPVQAMYTYALGVVGAFLTVIVAVAGFNYLWGRSTAWSETLPQVIMCGVMAWSFQPFLTLFIQLSNDFIFGMQFAVNLQPTFPAYGVASNAFMDILATIFELLGDLLLALEALVRLALLDLLIALSPLGIICYALPQTRGWGRLWAESLTATILIQPMQAILILLGAKMLSLLATFLQVGLPPLVQVLVGLASVYVALHVPTMLYTRATHVVGSLHAETAKIATALAKAAA